MLKCSTYCCWSAARPMIMRCSVGRDMIWCLTYERPTKHQSKHKTLLVLASWNFIYQRRWSRDYILVIVTCWWKFGIPIATLSKKLWSYSEPNQLRRLTSQDVVLIRQHAQPLQPWQQLKDWLLLKLVSSGFTGKKNESVSALVFSLMHYMQWTRNTQTSRPHFGKL